MGTGDKPSPRTGWRRGETSRVLLPAEKGTYLFWPEADLRERFWMVGLAGVLGVRGISRSGRRPNWRRFHAEENY